MINCQNLMKIYKIDDDHEVIALQGLDLQVEQGEMMGIIGSSGSGKSTLLNMLGGLDRPTAGKLIVNGKDMLRLSDKDLVKYKLETVGFVWQNNARNLIPYLTAVENVELPMLIKGRHKRERAKELLEMVGMGHRLNSRLNSLSGGEQQRVAIAISLANNPSLVLADEPTGSVDVKTADIILDVLRSLNRELGVTIVIVTHDTQLTRKMDRVVAIRDGKTSSEILRRSSYLQPVFDENGDESIEEDTHVELAVLDSARRIQVPEDYLEAIGIHDTNKVEMKLEDGRIIIVNPNEIKAKAVQ
ncbi:ABC transporter ATP-binding protein [Lederbergia citrea]|uniref:ABC transporter ATP-binding protein n=1 Tax=Lederbergia citrea TaxID=2833581 RepID=A0A942UKP6_9BACI|nr:ABC transporter ATP-binding protein [Lederbergia citrea]MBS4178236.1 ABC transporter ATP-binding protein [Lederbergia citrea]MBS4204913.1 ABC transporter ATP-binding protein [Lederbergia citrea]MBS4223236.1 ABC transporter ATP-binding protein [Lederbergia citrea]